MTNVRLKNIDRFIDRHGKPRHYYRAGKGPRVALPGQPGSSEFLVAYETAARNNRLAELNFSPTGIVDFSTGATWAIHGTNEQSAIVPGSK